MKSVIVLVPRLDNYGGVANYYRSIKSFLPGNVAFLYRGKDRGRNRISRILCDYAKYVRALVQNRHAKAVVINHSLGRGSFFRDGIYAFLTPKKYKKIVFFRGWNLQFQEKIDESYFLRRCLLKSFLKSDHIIVLASAFKAKLHDWGFEGPITLETTVVDEGLLDGETWESLSKYRASLDHPNLLYLGNIARGKGVWELVDALRHLSGDENRQNICLSIAGTGQELETLNKYTRYNRLNVEYLGYVTGKKKALALKRACIYALSSHGEGMPNAVLEAMAFGLPVITTRVGGIPDFFEDGKMGFFLASRQPGHIAERIGYLLDRPQLMHEMSRYNFEYAKEHFYARKVARRFMDIIESVIKGKNE